MILMYMPVTYPSGRIATVFLRLRFFFFPIPKGNEQLYDFFQPELLMYAASKMVL